MNVLRLISQLISIETLRLTYIYKYTGTEIFYSNGQTKMITKTVLITLNKSFVICELYLWHMKNFEIKRQKVPTLNEIPESALAYLNFEHWFKALLTGEFLFFFSFVICVPNYYV